MIGIFCVVLGFLVVGCQAYSLQPQATADVTNGSLVGFNTGNIAYFLGVPYASPPTGNLRFKTTVGANLPVMVFLHGGDYVTGLPANFNPQAMLNIAGQGVVAVTFDYRVNVFGFFSSGSGDSSNAGILDQVQALKWVQSEIRNFGGDPNRVTLVGHGAGASAASLHTFSPLSKGGLFQRVIQMSGSGFLPQAVFGGHNQFRSPSSNLAQSLGCSNSNGVLTDSAMACLRKASMSQILLAASKTSSMTSLDWSPHVGSADGFLPNWPRWSPRQSKLQIMVGVTANEEYVHHIKQLVEKKTTAPAIYNANQFNGALAVFANSWGKFSGKVGSVLNSTYYPSSSSTLNWFSAISELENGANYFGKILADVQDAIEGGSSVYLYSFDYISDIFPWPENQGIPLAGAYHGMDLQYLFNQSSLPGSLLSWNFSADDIQMSQTLTDSFISFISSGDPNPLTSFNPVWRPFTLTDQAFYSLALVPEDKLKLHPRADSVWNKQIPAITGNFGPTFPSYTGTGPTPYPLAPCATQPCQNQGICKNGGPRGHTCTCTKGWLGPNCSIAPCPVTTYNYGAYILVARYSNGQIQKSSQMTVGQKASFIAATGKELELQAVLGRKTSCLLSPALCSKGVTVSCSGTTLIGFQCTCK